MKILITGGCGFIGSNFMRYILREHSDWDVVNLDKLTYAGNLRTVEDVADDLCYKFAKGDIVDRELVDWLFAEQNFDAVVNFAAESHVDRSILHPSPFVETNIKGVQVLLDAVRKHKADRFIHISTDEVYGSCGKERYFTEESSLQPNSPYAASKAAADLLCRAYHKTYGVPVVITRSSNNYGPFQFPEKLIPLMINNALHGKPLPVYGKGQNIRDWLYVADTCRAIGLVLQKGRVGAIYNIGGGCEKKNIEIVELLCDILEHRTGNQGLRATIRHIKDPRGSAHDLRYTLDCSKIKKELGWEPRVNFEEGIRQVIDWYLTHQGWVEGVVTGENLENYWRIYSTTG